MSDADREHVFSEYLIEQGLTDEKWLGYLKQYGIESENNVLGIKGTENATTIFDEQRALANEEELKVLRKLLGVPNEIQDSEGHSIAHELELAGLDAEYWSSIFSDKLGVSTIAALKLVGGESYPILEACIKYPWEKRALREILSLDKMANTMKEQREKQKDNLQHRQNGAEEFLQVLREYCSEGKERNDEKVQKIECALRETLQVPQRSWIPQDKTLEELIYLLQTRNEQICLVLKSVNELDDAAILKSASGGLALRGIYLTGSLEDQLQDRGCILRAPEQVTLWGTVHHQKEQIKFFTSKQQENSFQRSVCKLGYSVSESMPAGFWDFKFDVNAAYTSSKKLKSMHEASNQEKYFSTVKFITMPLASYCFSDKDMCLSDDALKELTKIETISEADSSNLKHACESFFHQFGSHAIRGPLHFGGCFSLKCSSNEIKDSEKSAAKQLQNEAICEYTGLYHSSGTSNVFDIANIKSKYSGTCSETTLAQTILEINKNGGPPEISALADWKLGLVADNSTWSVIDRGTFLVPVWEIIQRNHIAHFKDVTNLVDVLYRAWKELAKLQDDADVISTACKVKEVVEVVEKWNKMTNMTHQDIEESLTSLAEVKRDLVKQSMNLEAWSPLYLSQSPIQCFLQSVVNAQQTNPPASGTEDVRKLLQQLLKRDDVNQCYTEKESMLAWIHGKDDTQQMLTTYQEINNFSKYLDTGIKKMDSALETYSLAFGQNVPSTKFHDGKISTAIERAVNSLLRSLQKSPAQKYEFLCFITLIYPFVYDYQGTLVVLKPLSLHDLKYLSGMIETQRKELLQSQTHKSLMQVQAFLFSLAVDIYCNKREIDTSLSQLKKHIHFMQQVLRDELHDTLQAHLADLSDDTTLSKLASELVHLKEIDPTQTWQKGPSLEQILKKVPEVVKLQDSQDENDDDLSASLDCWDTFSLFHNIDLMKYYPQKFSLQQALCIREDTLGEEKCQNPKHLPFFILHKIMSYDYRCRADLLRMPKPPSDFDSDDDDDDSSSVASWASAQEYVYVQVHPVDGLLAILHCADDFLRQDLMTRLATCQLAIPFLLPDPFTKQLTLPLWAMKSIIKEWKSTLGGCEGVYEGPITSYKTPIISFLRLSRQRKSKSNTMNEVISESKYEHFYHRNMEGGSYKQLLGDGVVDVCWYLPVGKAIDTFPDVVTFLNLHGDARCYPQQLAFLSQISIASFVFISEEDLNDESISSDGQNTLSGTEVLKTLIKSPSGVVLLSDKVPKGGKLDQAKKSISNKIHMIKMKNKNDDDIKKAVRQHVNKTLHDNWTKQRSEMIIIDSSKCVELAHSLNIKIDEDNKELIEGRALAESLIKILRSHKDQTLSPKEAMLPLQGKNLWLKWASLDKEEHRQVNRGGEKFDRYGLRKCFEKKQVRELQLHHVEHLTPLMESFIVAVLSSSKKVRDYFLQCVKLSLNNLSRQIISKLQRSYKESRSKLLKLQAKKEVNQEEVKECKTEIEELHEQMINASLGLEHLLRELGQVYEATQELKDGASEQISHLPRAAAELLISGYPLEIMDGDAAHVPSKWIKAVLDEVGTRLNDPNVFVLTVLGLQSTGKSTLMNTAFGLQFNVSAGRCTRGAFMQLLTITEELREQIRCDYILVIDTEGLRAPELDTLKTQTHDNELATFVIGLADVTLINIFGEAPGDMDDILQTAVHAFIRMNSVKLNPSCQFIHQNVGAVLANDKADMGRSRFKDKLDSMTRAAAKEENCEGQYEYFSEVIQFSDQNDVHQFPGLWRGDPPMAPVNPGYSEKAQQLVLHLIGLIKRKNVNGSAQLTTFKKRMQDLWKALLSESFVFSFKNTMEITVYNSLEAEYIQWSWSFKRQMLEWQQSAENKIKSIRDKSGLLALQKSLLKELPEFVQMIHEETQAKLIKYFEESKQREMLAQWQSDAQNRLKRLTRDEEDRAKDLCVQLSGAQRARAEVGNLNKIYRERMLANLKEVVASVEEEIKQRIAEQEKKLGPNVDEEQMRIAKEELKEKELQDTFRALWEEWIQEMAQTLPPQHDNIDVEADTHKALTEVFKSHDTMVIKELKSKPLRERSKTLSLQILRQHVALKKKSGILKGLSRAFLGKAEPNEAHMGQAEHITLVLFERTKDFLQVKRNEKYSAIHFQDLMRILIIAITDYTTNEHCELILTPDYRIAVCITACGFAMKQFEETVELMRKQNDPIAYLEQELRKPLYTMFKNKYNHTTQDKATAATFCELLAEPIQRQIENSLGPVLVTDIVATNPCLKTKVDLVTRMLIDMGDQAQQSSDPDLTEYFVYLQDSKRSLARWIKKYTVEHCEQGGEDGETKLVYLGKCQLASLISFIGKKVQEVSRTLNCVENALSLETWLNEVCNLEVLEGQLQLDLEIFDTLTNEVDELKDVNNFTEEVQAGLSRLHADLSKEVDQYTTDDMDTWQKRPYDILNQQLCGCCEQCPFCKEQCEYLTEGHKVEHHIKYHRPICLGGYQTTVTGEMLPYICSYLVTSETRFKNKDTGEKYHPFKQYAELYPKWKITPEKSLQAESYWKWFLGQYAEKVAADWGTKSNEIPKEWKTAFKWEDIRKELLNK